VTDDQRSSRPIFNSTLWAAAGWLFFRVARSTAMIQIAALRLRLEKQPTDLRRSPRDLGDGALIKSCSVISAHLIVLRIVEIFEAGLARQEKGERGLFYERAYPFA